ncbi:MAG: trypsin-like peptidase domain-containing protein [Candidatus Pacebacteria bacterium]|nr:trypsin-like peptidase domain-containing protein [Candidatus Paceibacterota bacterium]
MRKNLISSLLIVRIIVLMIFMAVSSNAWTHEIDPINKMIEEILYPVVSIYNDEDPRGSGVVVYSKKERRKKGKWRTFIITSKHVVAHSIFESTLFLSGRVGPRVLVPVTVRIYRKVESVGKTPADMYRSYETNIVAYDSDKDLALLSLQETDTGVRYVANLYKPKLDLRFFEPVWVVGAGLGYEPFPATGIISIPEIDEGKRKSFMFSAPIIFGNSGGGVYRYNSTKGSYELVGISRSMNLLKVNGIATLSAGSQQGVEARTKVKIPVTHMGVAVSVREVCTFLSEKGYGYICKE